MYLSQIQHAVNLTFKSKKGCISNKKKKHEIPTASPIPDPNPSGFESAPCGIASKSPPSLELRNLSRHVLSIPTAMLSDQYSYQPSSPRRATRAVNHVNECCEGLCIVRLSNTVESRSVVFLQPSQERLQRKGLGEHVPARTRLNLFASPLLFEEL